MTRGSTGLRWLVGLLLVPLLAAGCGDAPSDRVTYDPETDPLVNPPSLFDPAPEDASQIASDETLYVTLNANPNTLNPLFMSTTYDFMVIGTLYTGPFTFGSDLIWRLNEDMVESFEESEDHTEFTLRIKEGYTWHDGRPFTAHDIVYSWEQILDPRVPCPAVKVGTDMITECVALDDYTVRYVQPEATATRHWNIVFPVIPKHIFEQDKENNPDLLSGRYYNRQARHPVGNGPYRIVEWRENAQIIVERVEDYPGRKPHFRRVIFRIIPDNNVALLSFEKQEVDVVDRVTPQQFATQTNTPSFARVGAKAWGSEWSFSYIGWNMDGSNPFFGDRRVRRAMSHALNVPRIIERITYNLATPCYGIYHPDAWMFNPEIELIPFDLARAAALLDEAGWEVDSKDGWRYRQVDGRRVRFDFTLLMAQESQTAPRIAAIFQEDLRRIGVQMNTRSMEWASLSEQVRRHEFQAQTAGWGTGTDPDTGWNLWRTEEYEGGRNYGGYSNARVDELFELGRREFDFEKRRAIYQEIQKIIYEDQPYTFMYNTPLLAVFNNRIRGVEMSPRGIFNFDPGMEGWWVPRSGAVAAMVP